MLLGLVSKLDSWEQKLHWLRPRSFIQQQASPTPVICQSNPNHTQRTHLSPLPGHSTLVLSVFTPMNTSQTEAWLIRSWPSCPSAALTFHAVQPVRSSYCLPAQLQQHLSLPQEHSSAFAPTCIPFRGTSVERDMSMHDDPVPATQGGFW